ncbi:calcium uniporter protein 2, mitochondrial isoform X2 [Cajanus cajan]|uniref:calcium uniporter protein 2, mitochondrial isoform X2 n=1 Tax=Cajanus cajan TaxID=3821 RepID=UPI00098D85D4|nr:calcium uniporter protein 2, mitochondrial isoform X2 [Cajanus cajan]
MAFKKTLAQRLLNITKISTNYRISASSSLRSPIPTKPDIAPDPGDGGIFRRFLHKRAVFRPELRPPATDDLLQRLREMDIARSRIRLDGLAPPESGGVAVEDVRKVLRAAQIEAVKSKLRRIPQSCITYSELVRLCSENCSDEDQAMNVAKMLDDSASVIIIGDVVFLRPEQEFESLLFANVLRILPLRW